MVESRSLYEEDFARWSQEQAGAIRVAANAGANLPLDWENLAEEIESLGKSLKAELRSRIFNVIEHLIKLRYSPAEDPRRGWLTTIKRERREIGLLLEESPSLRPKLADMVARGHEQGGEFAMESLAAYGGAPPERRRAAIAERFTVEQVLSDWAPDRAPDQAG